MRLLSANQGVGFMRGRCLSGASWPGAGSAACNACLRTTGPPGLSSDAVAARPCRRPVADTLRAARQRCGACQGRGGSGASARHASRSHFPAFRRRCRVPAAPSDSSQAAPLRQNADNRRRRADAALAAYVAAQWRRHSHGRVIRETGKIAPVWDHAE